MCPQLRAAWAWGVLSGGWAARAEALALEYHELETEDAMPSVEFLEAFADGWNRHDVDALMAFMSDDCVFETTGGPEAWGRRYEGRSRVREAFAGVFKRFPDARFGDARHFVAGDRGCSEWRFTGTGPDGTRLEVQGCDLFTFRGGKIAVKSSFFKNRTA
jgi:ketosteroid isomerase-like protein